MLPMVLVLLGVGGAVSLAVGFSTDRAGSRWAIALGALALLVALAGVPVVLVDTWYRAVFG
ncbi:hypothetical protein DEF23_07825 [Marinitenerispora sediminis]|uniref:Major facilitator superfamily (MFS) profile domain-containing protein n=2 Tax=Marinitenerispora sediminis TaxID=1931232 RepID=A0A368TA99_9ACTN|nr:hypothetical protein DEF28_02845 [Marinitenerispora sediminis]RCV59014.1 hypothetical protein DEF23_07825 [Marinitenerispora sediminis]RCV61548.1 hypothetical protein DEF24_04015 [Marinitenerispora sediminis]